MGTYTLWGRDVADDSTDQGDLLYHDSLDYKQVWLSVKPKLDFSQDKTIQLVEKSARGKNSNGVPKKRVTYDSEYYYLSDSSYVYKWVLNSGSGDIDMQNSDQGLVESFDNKTPACTLYARINSDGSLEYSIEDPTPDEEHKGYVRVKDTLPFGTLVLNRFKDDPGYAFCTDSGCAGVKDTTFIIEGDIEDMSITPLVDIDTGWAYIPDLFDCVVSGDGNNQVSVGVNHEPAEQLRSVYNWDPRADSSLEVNNGSIVYTVPPPDKPGFWDDDYIKDNYDRIHGSVNKYDMFLSGHGEENPNLFIYDIEDSVKHINGENSALIKSEEVIDSSRYGNSAIRLSELYGASDTTVNIIGIEVKEELSEDLDFFRISVHHSGREEVITQQRNIETNWRDTVYYCNIGPVGGELVFTISYFNMDQNGIIDSTVKRFGQVSYAGHIVGEGAYKDSSGERIDNYSAFSPLRHAEIGFYRESGGGSDTTCVFDSINISSVNLLDPEKHLGSVPCVTPLIERGSGNNSPFISVTPTPMEFDSTKRPVLYYRYLRQEVIDKNIGKADIPAIFHIDSKSGELTDITSGYAAAYDYNGNKVFTAEDPGFDTLRLRDNWDYLEIVGIPDEFSSFAMLKNEATIRDRVELDKGKECSLNDLEIGGRYIPFIPEENREYTGPEPDGFRVLFNFLQDNVESRPLSSIRDHPDNDSVDYSEGVDLDSEFRFSIKSDDIVIPDYIGEGDTVYVYAFPYFEGEDIEYNAPVAFTFIPISEINLGYEVDTLNRFISQDKDYAEYVFRPFEKGKMDVVRFDKSGKIESTNETSVSEDDSLKVDFRGVSEFGRVREEGVYPFMISFVDNAGNSKGSDNRYEFVVDYTSPVISDVAVSVSGDNSPVFNYQAELSDNYSLGSCYLKLVDGYGNVLWKREIEVQGESGLIDTEISIESPWEYEGLKIVADVYDAAGNTSQSSIKCSIYEEDYENWEYSKEIEISLSEGVRPDKGIESYPLLVRLNSSNFDFSKARENGEDIRFTDYNGRHLLFEIERWDREEEVAEIWVRVPYIDINGSMTSVIMLWGNDDAELKPWISKAVWDRDFRAVYHMGEHKEIEREIFGFNNGISFYEPEYCIYSRNGVYIRDRAVVSGSGIGSDSYVEAGVDCAVTGDVKSRGEIFLRERASVEGDVIASEGIRTQNGVSVSGVMAEDSSVDQISIPERIINPGDEDVTGSPDDTVAVVPGEYGVVSVGDRGVLILSSGKYFVKELLLGTDVTIIAGIDDNGFIQINARDKVNFSDRTDMLFSNGEGRSHQIEIYSRQTQQFRTGVNSDLSCIITMPDADITVNSGCIYEGALYGNIVTVNPEASVNAGDDSGIYSDYILSGYGIYALDGLDIYSGVSINNGSAGSNTGIYIQGGPDEGSEASIQGDISSGGEIVMENHVFAQGMAMASGEITAGDDCSIIGGVVSDTNTPVVVIPSREFNPEGPDVYIDEYDSDTILPGDYGELTINEGSEVVFKGGVYNIREFRVLGDQAGIIYDITPMDLLQINVAERIVFNGSGIRSVFTGSEIPECVRFYTSQSNVLDIPGGTEISGIITAPEALVEVLPGARIEGGIYAERIKLHANSVVDVQADPLDP
ncbi:MAG: DUF2341 domain-containing protein, partial [Chitinivibrionales bacterium]